MSEAAAAQPPAQPAARLSLAEQRALQVRADFRHGFWLAPVIAVGFVVSALGLGSALYLMPEIRSPMGQMIAFGAGVALFGSGLVLWLTSPFLLKPRLVPYFARELEPYGPRTSIAFWRGHGLYRDIEALDRIAAETGVIPLSAFGFADDYYGQTVQWHPATEALRTITAIRASATSERTAADLDALASVLNVAVEKNVEFCLCLRVRKDSLQVVSAFEHRQGRFW